MTIKALIQFFETFQRVPVEIQDVRDQILEAYGIEDEIILHRADMDPNILVAMLVRFTERRDAYAPPRRCALIIYSGNVPIEVQRLAVCKELVHLLDVPALQSRTRDDVITLIKNLTEGFNLTQLSVGDWQAMKDKIALYQALAVLFPHELREDLMEPYENGTIDDAWIAEYFSIPEEHVELLMSDKWDGFRRTLMEL
jgi:hypothetical protein